MNNQIQLVLKSSTAEMPLNDQALGIYLTPELDGLVGLPEIRTTSGVNAGYDGGWTSAQNYDARSITIRGVIANEDVATVERLRKQLVSLAGQGKSEELTLDLVTQAGNAYTLQVRTIALEMSMQSVLTQQQFMLQLRADDPLIYDAGESEHEATLQVAQATGGFTIDFELPLAITGGSEESVVNNDGLEEVPTIVKMYGALHNPKIINQTNNEQMQIMTDLGFAEGAWHSPSEASEGTSISLANTPDSAPFSDIQLKGDTAQTTYTGKNLFDVGQALEYKWISATTGLVVDSGDPNIVAPLLHLEIGKTYVISGIGNLQFNLFSYTDSNFSNPVRQINNSTSVRTYTAATEWARFAIGGGNATAIENNIQFELGSTATAYEPYCGGMTSPNPYYPQTVKTVTGENTIKIEGKNLLYVPDGSSAPVSNSVVLTAQNGAINFKTNSSISYVSFGIDKTLRRANYGDYITWAGSTLKAGTYTLSYRYLSGSTTTTSVGSNFIRVICYSRPVGSTGGVSTSEAALTVGAADQTATFTISEDKEINVVVYLYVGSGDPVTDINFNVQLEKSDQATPFEVYRSQSYGINLGKNLFDKTAATLNYRLGSDGAPYGDSNYFLSDYIPIEPSTDYTFSRASDGTSNSAICYYDKDKTFISPRLIPIMANAARSKTVTTPSNAAYIRFTDNKTTIDTVQFEAGSTATTYAAYFTPIELCKIGDYQDYIYKSGDKWYKHEAVGKVTLDGSETYGTRTNTSTTHSKFRITNNVLPSAIAGTATLLCSNFVANSGANTQSYSDNAICGSTASGFQQQLWFSIENSIANTTSAFQTWVSNNMPTVYYAEAAPTDTEITNEALIAQLDDLLNLSRTYQGQTNLADLAASGNMPAILNVSYFTEQDPDTRDELIIDSRLHTVTLNGLDIYHLIGEGSEFLMLEPGENRLSLQSDITGDNGYAVVSYKQGYLSI